MGKDVKKQNRVLYIVSVMVLMILAVLVAVTGVARRNAADPKPQTTGTARVTAPPATLPGMAQTEGKPATTPPPATESSPKTDPAAAIQHLPEFTSMPAAGTIAKKHSEDVPVLSVTMNDYRTHTGIDIAAKVGDPVCAAAEGVIGNIWSDPFLGNCISIVHSGGAVSIYRNLAEEPSASVGTGASVKAGQVIGYIGESALIECADEAHLHYELTVDGKAVDPMKYLPDAASAAAYED